MEQTQPQIRQRVNVSQTAKGLHQVECTVEVIEPIVDGKAIESTKLVQDALNLLEDMEKKLKQSGRKLVTDSE